MHGVLEEEMRSDASAEKVLVLHLASYSDRGLAAFVDFGLWFLVLLPGLIDAKDLDEMLVVLTRMAAVAFVVFVVQGFFWTTRAQSVGKMLFGLKIVDEAGRNASGARIILARFFPFALVGWLPGIGQLAFVVDTLLMLHNARRQCAHDLLAGTYVVRT